MKIRVKKAYNLHRKSYPWFPKIGGLEGVVQETKDMNGEKLYIIKLNKPFLIGIIPEGTACFDYKPKEFRSTDICALTINDFDWI